MKKFVSFFLLFLSLSCADTTSFIPHEPAGDELHYKTIPFHATIGEQIKIIDNFPDSSNARYAVTFYGVGDWVLVDSVVNDTMFVIVPFTAITGPVKIGEIPILNIPALGMVENFVMTDNSIDTVHLMWSGLNYPITEQMSNSAWGGIIEREWQVEQIGDTIKLNTVYMAEYSGARHHLVLLDRGAGLLPKFIDGYGVYLTDVIELIKTHKLEKGVIKIEKWDTSERIIGRVFGVPWTENEYSFYIRF